MKWKTHFAPGLRKLGLRAGRTKAKDLGTSRSGDVRFFIVQADDGSMKLLIEFQRDEGREAVEIETSDLESIMSAIEAARNELLPGADSDQSGQ